MKRIHSQGFWRLMLAACVALVCCTALASESKRFSWTAPVEYEDGTPLNAADLDSYQIGCGAQPGERDADVRTFSANGATERFETFAAGEHFCALRVRALIGSELTDWSAWSNEVGFTVPHPAPAPITDLAVD